jgi:hypothetical protein
MYASGNSDNGIRINNVRFFDLDTGTLESNTGYGLYIDENATGNRLALSFANLAGTITIQDNAGGGIVAKNHSIIALTNVDGSNTGDYGLELQTGSNATITSDTGITGNTADATINAGATLLTWATHFASDGDIARNEDNGCRIERKD